MRQRENSIVEDDLFTSSNSMIHNFSTGLVFIFFSQNIFPQFATPDFKSIPAEDGLRENSFIGILPYYVGYLRFYTQKST